MVQGGQLRKRSLSSALDSPRIRIRKNLAAVGYAITATDVSPGTKFGLSGDRQTLAKSAFERPPKAVKRPSIP